MQYIQKEHKNLKGIFKWTIGDLVYIAKTNAKSGFASRFNSIFTALKSYLQDLAKPKNNFDTLFMSNEYSSKYLYTKLIFALLQLEKDPKKLLTNFKDLIKIEILESSEEIYDEAILQELELKHIFENKCYIYGLNQNETAQLFFDRSVNRKFDYTNLEKNKLQAGILEFKETFNVYLNDLQNAIASKNKLETKKEFLIKYNSLNITIAFDELYFFDYIYYEKWDNFDQLKQDHWDIIEQNNLIKETIADYNEIFKIKGFI
ncbi:hypothetical protein [Mycoplasma buteonis]|uniref:hypothetical protein n=1 Tax=Mycoplasma buteonis TaxID=171280 RepID=UPI00055DEE42|nr:hypothetical protein [Mycoplasma buteonis]